MGGPHRRHEEAGNQESESNPASRHDGDFNGLNLTEIRQLAALRLRRSLDCGKPASSARLCLVRRPDRTVIASLDDAIACFIDLDVKGLRLQWRNHLGGIPRPFAALAALEDLGLSGPSRRARRARQRDAAHPASAEGPDARNSGRASFRGAGSDNAGRSQPESGGAARQRSASQPCSPHGGKVKQIEGAPRRARKEPPFTNGLAAGEVDPFPPFRSGPTPRRNPH